MAHVWCAFAGSEGATEENLIGIYTSRTKARRAILEYFQFDRGRWEGKERNRLDADWLIQKLDDHDAYGYVSQRAVL